MIFHRQFAIRFFDVFIAGIAIYTEGFVKVFFLSHGYSSFLKWEWPDSACAKRPLNQASKSGMQYPALTVLAFLVFHFRKLGIYNIAHILFFLLGTWGCSCTSAGRARSATGFSLRFSLHISVHFFTKLLRYLA